MTPTPEPAVGQVWMLPDGQVIHILELDAFGFAVVGNAYHHHYLACALRIPVAPDVVRLGWEYLGTLDELLEHQALKRDAELWRTQVHTDNSAVIANLEAENAKLRAAARALYYAAHWIPDRPCAATQLWTDLRDACGFEHGQSPTPP